MTEKPMDGAELKRLMARAGLVGQPGAEELASRVGTSWRSVYRWRGDYVKITRMAEKSLRRALETQQDHASRIRPAARKSKTTKQK